MVMATPASISPSNTIVSAKRLAHVDHERTSRLQSPTKTGLCSQLFTTQRWKNAYVIRSAAKKEDEHEFVSSANLNCQKTTTNMKGLSLEEPSKVPYGLIAMLSTAGALETLYLSWVKISGSTVLCPIGGESCSEVLNSDYAMIYGVPLTFVGAAAYTSIALLSLNMRNQNDGIVRWILLGGTTAMAAASAYFMYILNVKLDASCTYCMVSAAISFTLLLSTIRGFTSRDILKMAGLQLSVTASVIVMLTVAFAGSGSALAGLNEIDLPPVEPEVTAVSDTLKISLAKHLHSIGAKMYGAFWCSHCHEQKEMFGQEAVKYLDYIECYPEGYRRGVQIAKACDEANIKGFPTWVIKDQALSGEQTLDHLAELSGFSASNQ